MTREAGHCCTGEKPAAFRTEILLDPRGGSFFAPRKNAKLGYGFLRKMAFSGRLPCLRKRGVENLPAFPQLFHRAGCAKTAKLAFGGDVGVVLSFRAVARQVLSPPQSLTSVFGMGTGGPSASKTPTAADPIGPTRVSDALFSRAVARQVLSPRQSLTSVFGMGTGGPSAPKSLTMSGVFRKRPLKTG